LQRAPSCLRAAASASRRLRFESDILKGSVSEAEPAGEKPCNNLLHIHPFSNFPFFH
jgi:hypothetical protein